MAQIYFEDIIVPITEDRKTSTITYTNSTNKLIEKKVVDITVSSGNHYYKDGLLLFLTFDHQGADVVINANLHSPAINLNKKFLEISNNGKLFVNRLDHENFLCIVDERANEEGYILFVNVSHNLSVRQTRVNYSKLLEKVIINNKYTLLNFYEKLNDAEKIHTIILYDCEGKQIDTIFDEKVMLSDFFTMQHTFKDGKHIVDLYKTEAFKTEKVHILTHTLEI